MIRIVLILSVTFMLCYAFGDQISEWLLMPLRGALGKSGKVVYLGLLDKVLSQFQVAFWSCVIFSSPLWFRELWLFIKPALYESEKNVIRPFIIAGFVFFVLGISFGYFIVNQRLLS